jgi:hypothetical protein
MDQTSISRTWYNIQGGKTIRNNFLQSFTTLSFQMCSKSRMFIANSCDVRQRTDPPDRFCYLEKTYKEGSYE